MILMKIYVVIVKGQFKVSRPSKYSIDITKRTAATGTQTVCFQKSSALLLLPFLLLPLLQLFSLQVITIIILFHTGMETSYKSYSMAMALAFVHFSL